MQQGSPPPTRLPPGATFGQHSIVSSQMQITPDSAGTSASHICQHRRPQNARRRLLCNCIQSMVRGGRSQIRVRTTTEATTITTRGAHRSMDQPRRFLKLALAIQIFLQLSNFITPVQTAQEVARTRFVESQYFQPTLIGYRFEGPQDFTLDGISIIEANSPIKLTLFGESFTTDTIVGFTTEFVQVLDEVGGAAAATAEDDDDLTSSSLQIAASLSSGVSAGPRNLPRQISTHQARLNFESDDPNRNLEPPTLGETLSNFTTSLLNNKNNAGVGGDKSQHSPLVESRRRLRYSPKNQTELGIRDRRFKRRLLDRRSYDCTDYDRIISYKLTEDNLITPNVAVLTVRLPELELSSSSGGMYYHFCLKQPALLNDGADETYGGERARNLDSMNAAQEQHYEKIQQQRQQHRNRTMVWVHQGDEWWLTIKVEPPILSITNDCFLIVALLFLSAVTSGLNLGLMSLDMNELAVISSCGDPRERSYARTIAPLRKRGNYLLCSLLLGNVMVNSTLTVILEEMTSGVVAVIGSTLAIVVLGEIVPQAFCARQGLAIGAKTIYLTYAFMIITFPLSYPISRLLDCVLGEEKGNVYDRERLMEFIRITGNHTQLEADEVAIISGALKLKKIKVDQIMTKIEDVFMLPIDCMLDRKTIRSIIEKGYSRIPIYELGDRKQIVALILAKDLALLDPDDQMPLASMLKYCKHPLVLIEDTATLDVALNEFKTGKSHMAIVRQLFDDGEVDKYYEAIGVVTLEDVIEEVLQTEINDETDTLSDNRRKRRRTEAQVAHLVDELITTTTATTATAANAATTATTATVSPMIAAGIILPPSTKF